MEMMSEINLAIHGLDHCLSGSPFKCDACPFMEYGENCGSALLKVARDALKEGMWFDAAKVQPLNREDVIVCCDGYVLSADREVIPLEGATEFGYWSDETKTWYLSTWEDGEVKDLKVRAWRKVPAYE